MSTRPRPAAASQPRSEVFKLAYEHARTRTDCAAPQGPQLRDGCTAAVPGRAAAGKGIIALQRRESVIADSREER